MASVNYKSTGIVTDIQRFNVNDGPGIRTIVFLKGCPLSCIWCSNPETQQIKPVIMFEQEQCISCGKCAQACRTGAIGPNRLGVVDHKKCVICGECTNVCPTGALILKGETLTVGQIVKDFKKDATLYRKSGGGITLSGGEPLVQWKFATELIKACKAQGWHTAMETTGFGSDEAIESVFSFLDLALLDIKTMNDEKHKDVTGVSNEVILRNAVRIAQMTDVIIRVPTVPTVNDTEEDFVKISEFAKTLRGVDTVHILPYHSFGEHKYESLGMEYQTRKRGIKPLPPKETVRFKEVVESKGLHCSIGG